MSNYKRLYLAERSYFFTVVTAGRRHLFKDEDKVELLRSSFRYVMQRRPFKLDAICILADHIHCIWTLIQDANHSVRWQMIKTSFTRSYRQQLPEQSGAIWQPRYWEHVIRDETDWKAHLDYIHYNPVKHGLVKSVSDWRFSSYQKFMQQGYYEKGWGSEAPESIDGLNLE